MNTQSILLTGGTGFVGSHLVECLQKKGYQNIHVTSFGGNKSYVSELLPADHIHQIDLIDQSATIQLLKDVQPTQIYHLAAWASVASSFDQSQLVLENNLKLQVSVLDAVRAVCPTVKVLAVGSAMEYDFVKNSDGQKINELHPLGPVSPYAVSKVIQDLLSLSYVYSYQLQIVRARSFNHIGERQTTDFAIPSFAKQIVAIERREQDSLHVGNLDAVRDFTDVKDVVEAYFLLMEKGEVGEVYNVGSGKGYTMQEMLDQLCALSSTKIEVVTDPEKVRPLDVASVIADIEKITELGWTPQILIAQTLERILEEWRRKV